MTDDTCNPKCKFWKKYKESCPFFIETTWTPVQGDGQAKTHKDCAPKRSVLLQMEMFNTIGGLHRASNQERNSHNRVLKTLLRFIPGIQIEDDIEKVEAIEGGING